ncbi:oligopeptide/dipeptide ABC transporter ATP-binding protein, partial [Pseudomonas typographi]|uniref:oligopeptide/dipeptide ABC transporter ATP-binding protein n=1 Tax=Pseudomonas typographi TaxID=2715964 RepID=UPI0030B8B3C3|nr:ABC transporter ATP-binding protein [Pseudomonas typographi]MBD1588251.1 ABC transporter ATP-binding protein [Pseudomonas typographi]
PYTRALLGSVLTPDPHLGIPDIGLGGSFPNPISPPSGCAFHPRCPQVFGTCASQRPEALPVSGGRVACHLNAPPSQPLELIAS